MVAEPEGTLVGTVHEDFAVEAMAGDVFLLGNTPWRIRRVEQGRVRVQDAQGMAPTIPFWLGEAPGRTVELSDEVSSLREALDDRLQEPDAAAAWLRAETGAAPEDAEQAVAYIEEGVRVLGHVPTRRRVVAERFFDEAGGCSSSSTRRSGRRSTARGGWRCGSGCAARSTSSCRRRRRTTASSYRWGRSTRSRWSRCSAS